MFILLIAGAFVMMASIGGGLLCWAGAIAMGTKARERDTARFTDILVTLGGLGAVVMTATELVRWISARL